MPRDGDGPHGHRDARLRVGDVTRAGRDPVTEWIQRERARIRPDGVNRLHLDRSRQRREDDLRRLGDGAGRVRPARAGLDVRLRRLPACVVNDQLVPRLLEIGRHVAAHRADADEADLHDFVS
jgi:hypothetical protein